MIEKEIKILIFNINDEYYATDIMEVERILGYSEPTKLPDTPKFVEGVINYQGSILPVISIAKKFNIPFKGITDESKIIVAKEGESRIGIIVDLVSEVRNIKEDIIENPPEIAVKISKRYIKGLVNLDNRIVIFLNLAKILTDEEMEIIK